MRFRKRKHARANYRVSFRHESILVPRSRDPFGVPEIKTYGRSKFLSMRRVLVLCFSANQICHIWQRVRDSRSSGFGGGQVSIPGADQKDQGRIQEFLIGGVQTLVQKGLLGGEGINYSPTRHPDQSQLYVIMPWSLILYKWILLVMDVPLEHAPLALGNKDCTDFQSQSVNAGHRWRMKYCFASRGEQIIGGYPKTIPFFNIPRI